MQLLPPNASALQRTWQQALNRDSLPKSVTVQPQDIQNIAGFKAQSNENLLPWLVWEYGLEPLLPYIPDMRQAIQQGLEWQQIRGTPKSLLMALEWLDFKNAHIESSPTGRHYYRYQLDSGQVPNEESLAKIAQVAKLSAPVRAKLSRVYHHYDIRNQTLSGNTLGHMLSDYSGVPFVHNGQVLCKASFARNEEATHVSMAPDVGFSHRRQYARNQHYLTGIRLGHYTLSDKAPEGFPVKNGVTRYFSDQVPLVQSSWVGQWQGRWQSKQVDKPLISASVYHGQTRQLAPIYLAGAHTGRMNVHYSYFTPTPKH